jgi:hypothetical protein
LSDKAFTKLTVGRTIAVSLSDTQRGDARELGSTLADFQPKSHQAHNRISRQRPMPVRHIRDHILDVSRVEDSRASRRRRFVADY